ncbi:DUF2306 domain-containing protein [Saccharopolyspora hordei]|uniref:Uncharacterized membrane protein YozB (DUF420 family) n=1 Tax=Saccharopolyspora hordei TaxID=1838 RepID=A0A853AKM3_9PSEU|nr:uncharacterized membrane protein YozB (DUF420 family) [Saccharopolyspora hordei]
MSTVVRPAVQRSPVRWWRRPWVGPLALVAVLFLVYSLPPYLTGDPALSRVQVPSGGVVHYPLLVGHVLFGAVAMLTCCFQVWPAFRARSPRAHRLIGRVYVVAGVLPASVLAVPVALFAPFGPVAAVSNVLLGLLWFGCTVAGWRAARQRRFRQHRRWMVRSFVLTMSIVTNRLWGPVWTVVLAPQLPTTFGGDEAFFGATVAGLTTWTGWVLPLLACQWWLDRRTPAAAR